MDLHPQRPPGGVRSIGLLMRVNAVYVGLAGAILVVKSSDDDFLARVRIPSRAAPFAGLALLLVAGLSWVLVMALYDRSRGARAIVAGLMLVRIAGDLAGMATVGTGRAALGLDAIWAVVILLFLFGTPSATEWFRRPPVAIPPRPR